MNMASADIIRGCAYSTSLHLPKSVVGPACSSFPIYTQHYPLHRHTHARCCSRRSHRDSLPPRDGGYDGGHRSDSYCASATDGILYIDGVEIGLQDRCRNICHKLLGGEGTCRNCDQVECDYSRRNNFDRRDNRCDVFSSISANRHW